MPLTVLLILVGGGIGGIVVLLHVLGKSTRVILSNTTAGAAWSRLFPDDTVEDVTVSADGYAALITTTSGLGLVWSFGSDTVARPLTNISLSETRNCLKIGFDDFSAPSVSLTLSETERADWRQRMAQI